MAKIKVDENKLTVAFSKARSSLIAFRYIILLNDPKNEVKSAPFHYLWSEDVLNGKGNSAWLAFRESAKTQYILRSFLLYSIMFPSVERDYIVLIKANATLAGSKLSEIISEAMSNPAIRANIVKVNKQSSDCFDIDVKSNGAIYNVRIEAYGKGASIRGLSNKDRRPKIVIVDDPQDSTDARSDSITASDWQWFLSDVMFLGQNTRIFLIGNNLGDRCIVPQAFANADKLSFKTSVVPILTVKDGQEVSAWPEKVTVESIHKERENYRAMGQLDVWTREKLCISVSEETRVFKAEDMQYYQPSTALRIASGCNVTACLDPASSMDKGSCYRAITVLGVTEDNQWFWLDCKYGRWSPPETIDMIFLTIKQWRPRKFGIEKGHFKQILEHFIRQEMNKRNVFFNITEIEHAKAGSKLERVKMLAPRHKAKTMYFPQEADWLSEFQTELYGVTKDGFKSNYQDLIDSAAMHEQIAEAPITVGAGVGQEQSYQTQSFHQNMVKRSARLLR